MPLRLGETKTKAEQERGERLLLKHEWMIVMAMVIGNGDDDGSGWAWKGNKGKCGRREECHRRRGKGGMKKIKEGKYRQGDEQGEDEDEEEEDDDDHHHLDHHRTRLSLVAPGPLFSPCLRRRHQQSEKKKRTTHTCTHHGGG